MIAEIILVLVPRGSMDTVRACAQNVARALSAAGITVNEQISVCHGGGDLQKAVATALGRCNIVITLGGLGIESGGITRTVIAGGLGLPIDTNHDCYRAIEDYCQRTGTPLMPGDAALAQAPRGSVVFPGRQGKTPGIVVSSAKQHIILLPDAQQEAISLLNDDILPHLQGKSGRESAIVTRTLRTYGITEETVRRTISHLMGTVNPAVTVLTENNEVLVQVTGRYDDPRRAAALCTPVLRKIVDLLGDAAYGLDVESLQAAVVENLSKKQMRIAIAESGSAGMLARVISETAGGSEVLEQSFFADNDNAKREMLDVPPKLLKKRGGVSEEVAVAMADGARRSSGANLGVALTMGRGREKSPGGLVYIAVCNHESVYVKKLVVGEGDPAERSYVVDASLSRALNMIRLFIDYLPGRYMGSIPLEEALAGKTVTDSQAEDSIGEPPPDIRVGFFRRFFGNFIIRGADRPGVKVKKVIFILAVLIFLGSGAYIANYVLASWEFRQRSLDYSRLYTYGDADIELPQDFPRNYQDKFAALYAVNPDVVGYISLPGTQMSYPVVQGDDNSYYLRRDFDGTPVQFHGIPFLDWRADAKKPSDNLVIYGHNIKDGTLFGELLNYSPFLNEDALGYFKEHPVVEFSTVYGDGQYKIFSIFITNAYENQGIVFDYHNFIDSKSNEDFERYLDQLRSRTLIDTGVDVQPGDKLITLSTCTYEFTDARFVVVARKLRRGESADDGAAGAVINPEPLMPDVWYQVFGGSRPEGAMGANVVTSPATAPPASISPTPLPTRDEASLETPPPTVSRVATSQAPDASGVSSSSQQPDPVSSSSSQTEPPPASSQPEPSAASSRPEPSAASSQPEPELEPEPKVESEPEPEPFFHVSEQVSSEPDNSADIPERIRATSEYTADEQEQPRSESTYSADMLDELMVTANGQRVYGDVLDIVSRVVQNEVGSSFHTEAIKAQAVAAYSYIKFYNNTGSAPSVILASRADSKVVSAVEEVLGQAVYYGGRVALTPYHATSAGLTTSSRAVWGTGYSYLVPVDSFVDQGVKGYESTKVFSYDQVCDLISSRMGFSPEGSPEEWFYILGYTDGDYVGDVSVCGRSTTSNGKKITGRYLRESVFSLRSASFTVDYDSGRDQFIFTTYGYGHGVGLSQNGANQYANQGWNYVDILTHYYQGTEVY